MLEVAGLSFDYQDKPLLNEVEFRVKPGQLLHLQGRNGAGKTTLLRLIAGLLQPYAGDIRYQNKSIQNDLAWYSQKICYMGHKTGINPLLTVKENCYFDMHWGRKEINFDAMLALFELQTVKHELCSHLSAGQCRRVGLLRLAFTDAPLWLLDEPLVALDLAFITQLMILFENHLNEGGQIIVTSHQPLPLVGVKALDYSLG